MLGREALILEYYSPPNDGFWQWQDDGAAAGWRDGKLITFDRELTSVLKHVAPHGLPRLGSLLLLIAATRNKWAVDESEARLLTAMIFNAPSTQIEPQQEALRRKPSSAQRESETQSQKRFALLQRVLEGLHKVHALDPSLRTSPEAKAALACIVFDGAEPVVPDAHALPVADAIRPGLLVRISSEANVVSNGYGSIFLLRDLADLALGLERVTPEAVRLRLETGIDALPKPASIHEEEEVLAASDSARAVIQELLDAPEYSGMAMLAKRLLASTTLPRKLSHSQEQEMGGYSDIANRGPPDRLLLSELAQDGLTLAVRVAMNEAMYLHRETPPTVPRVRRELLTDSGVHAWGLPRLFAASAALAFAGNTPPGASFAAWRGSGDSLKEVDLSSTEGFIEHLNALEPDPHLGDALPRFGSRIGESEDPVEAIVLMPADSLAEPELAQTLRGLSADRIYVATFDRNGEFRLSEWGPRGQKLIRSARLPLDQVVAGGERLKQTEKLNRLPAIFRVQPFPLRLPVPLNAKTCWSLGDQGVLSVTGDGRLLRWTSPIKGAEQLSDRLHKGQLWWASPDCFQGSTSFVFGPSQKPVLYRVDLSAGEVQAMPLRCPVTSGVTFHNGVLFCIHAFGVTEVNPRTGEAGRQLTIPSNLRWIGGRYFRDRDTNAWVTLSHDGQAATIDSLPSFRTSDPVVFVWDAVGFDEPVALTSRGRLLAADTDRGKLPDLEHALEGCSVVEASHDGKRLVVSANYHGNNRWFELTLNVRPQFVPCHRPVIDSRIAAVARPATIRKRFHAVGVADDGALALRATKSVVVLEHQLGQPALRQRPRDTPLSSVRRFEELEADIGYRFRLSRAEWKSGDKVTLDSRGLLHLQPENTDTPEITLVLAEGEMTGWHSGGQLFGKKYFLPEDAERSRKAGLLRMVHEEAVAPFVESIRASD